jgi:VCBS repeat-containing protein
MSLWKTSARTPLVLLSLASLATACNFNEPSLTSDAGASNRYAPVAVDGSFTTAEDVPYLGVVVASDDDGNPMTYTIMTAPAHGTVAMGPGYAFTYTPAANYAGHDSFTFVATDGTFTSRIATVSITVTAVNDRPVITGQQPITTAEDTPVTLTLADLVVTDPDNNYPADFTLTVLDGAHYTHAGAVITPAADWNGTLTIPVTVSDGSLDSVAFDVHVTVTAVNNPPVITGQQAVSTAEDTAVTLTLADLTVTDPDNSYPTGFTLAIGDGANYAHAGSVITPAANFNGTLTVPVTVNDGAADSNSFNVTITVTAVNDPPVITGQQAISTAEDTAVTLTLADLTVVDPDNSYPIGFTLAIGDGVNYAHAGAIITPAANFNGTLTVPVTVNDGAADSNSFNLSITVTAVNDPPVITGQNPVTIAEDTAYTVVFADLLVTDPDNTYPTGFTLTVANGTNYSHSGNIITPAANFNGTLTVPVKVNDGAADSNSFNLSITVTPVNDPPVITGQNPVATLEDTAYTVKLADLVVSDPDNTYPTGFTVTVLDGAGYTHVGNAVTPALNFNGLLAVSVKVNDGAADSNTFALAITVTPVNDAPTITGQGAVSVLEGGSRAIVLGDLTVIDPDNIYPTDFTLTVLDGTNYTHAGNTISPVPLFNGTLTVPVKVNDGAADSPAYDLIVAVSAVNNPPAITGQNPIVTAEETPYTVKLADLLVTDPDNPYPTGFTLTVSDGTNYTRIGATITPAVNFNGTLTVPVKVNDGTDDSNTFNLQIVVSAVDDAPVITGQNPVSTAEDTAYTVKLADLVVTDVDNTYPTGFTLTVGDGAHYTHVGNTITPAADWNGTLSVPVTVNDGSLDSNSFSLQVTVTPVNDPPTIADQNPVTTPEETPYTVKLADLVVTDVDNTYPTGFTLRVGDGANYTRIGATITPAVNFNGTLTVPVTVNDGAADSNSFDLQVTVTAVNDPPVIAGQGALATDEDTPVTIALTDLIVTDPDNSYPADFTLIIGDGPNYTHAGNVITPAVNWNGTLTVPVTVNDGQADSNSFDLQITVNAVNDPPHIITQGPVITAEDTPVTIALADLVVTDPDNAYPADFSLTVGNGANYTHIGNTITPAVNFNGTLTVPVTVNDGAADSNSFDLQVTVTPVNDAPVITGQNPISMQENDSRAIVFGDLAVSDPDNSYPDDFSLAVRDGANYTHAGNTISPTAGFAGTLSVPVTVNDGQADSNIYTLTVTVVAVPPTAAADAYASVGNTRLTVGAGQGVLANDSAASPPFSVVDADTASTAGGIVAVNADGSFTYLPPVGGTGVDQFHYTIRDANNQEASGTVSITVGPTMVWYVDDSNAGAADGRSSRPFTSLAAAQAASAAGQIIFVYAGTGGTYAGGIALKAGQSLIGEGAGLSILPNVAIVPGARPTLGNGGGAAVTLASSTAVTEVNISAQAGFAGAAVTSVTLSHVGVVTTAGAGLAVTDAGTIVLDDVAFTTQGDAIAIDNGSSSGHLTLQAVVATATNGRGLHTSNLALLSAPDSGNVISATGGAGLDLDGAALAASFASVSSTGSSGRGHALANVSGTLVVTGSATATAPTSDGFAVLSSTAAISLGQLVVNGGDKGLYLFDAKGSFIAGPSNGSAVGDGGQILSPNSDAVSVLGEVDNLTLRFLDIQTPGRHGVAVADGAKLVNFTFRGGDVVGAGDTQVGAPLSFGNGAAQLTGTATIADATFDGSETDAIFVDNRGDGTLDLTLTNVTVTNLHNGASGLVVRADAQAASPTINLVVDGCHFTGLDLGSNGINVAGENFFGAHVDAVIKNSTFNGNAGSGDNAVRVAAAGDATVTFDVKNNDMQSFGGHVVSVSASDSGTIMEGYVRSNTIVGSVAGDGINVVADPDPTAATSSARVWVAGNSISQIAAGYGIFVLSRNTSATDGSFGLDAVITSNDVTDAPAGFDAISAVATDNANLCAALWSNSVGGTMGAGSMAYGLHSPAPGQFTMEAAAAGGLASTALGDNGNTGAPVSVDDANITVSDVLCQRPSN